MSMKLYVIFVVVLVTSSNLGVLAQEDETTTIDFPQEIEEDFTSTSTTPKPKGFTFRPEVLRKFRLVLKKIFNFDALFNTPPSLLLRTPNTFNPTANTGARKSQFKTSPSRTTTDEREYLEETAEIPQNHARQPAPQQNQQFQNEYDQRRRYYEQYWQNYYYGQRQPQLQQQYSPYYNSYGANQNNYWYNNRQPVSQINYNPYQPQQYQPQNYWYNQQQQQSPYQNPYYNQQQYYGQQQGFNIGSGLTIGMPNGQGFGINSGLGFNLGR